MTRMFKSFCTYNSDCHATKFDLFTHSSVLCPNRSFTEYRAQCRIHGSGVTKGGKGRYLLPDEAFWRRQVEVGMLRNNYKMSNASDCCPVAQSHQDHQDSQSELLRTLYTYVSRWSFRLQQSASRVVSLMAAITVFQIARGKNFPTSLSFSYYSCVTIGLESSAHSACSIYCAMGVGRIFPGGHYGIFPIYFKGRPKVVKFVFLFFCLEVLHKINCF